MLKCHTGSASNHCHYYFFKDGGLVYRNDGEGLLYELGRTHNTEEWTLFLDSSKFSSNAMLLRNGNIHLSIPIADCPLEENLREYGLTLESYTLLKIWMEMCGDLKVTGLLGIQSGYTKSFSLSFVHGRTDQKTRYSSPVIGLEWPRGFEDVKVPIFHDNGTG